MFVNYILVGCPWMQSKKINRPKWSWYEEWWHMLSSFTFLPAWTNICITMCLLLHSSFTRRSNLGSCSAICESIEQKCILFRDNKKDKVAFVHVPSHLKRNKSNTITILACENSRFSSLFPAGDVSRGRNVCDLESGEKRLFSQAIVIPSLALC